MALITKLTESVNNADLLRLGEILINIAYPSSVADENIVTVGMSGGGQYVRCGSAGYLFDDSSHAGDGVKKKVIAGNSGSVYYDDEVVKLFVAQNDKVNSIGFTVASGASGADIASRNSRINIGDAKRLQFMTALTALNLYGASWEGDIADLLSAPALITLRVCTQRTGTASDFTSKRDLQTLDITYSPNITGEVADFSNLTSLTRLYLGGSGITGNAASIKSVMESAGRHSGSMSFQDRFFSSTTITFE